MEFLKHCYKGKYHIETRTLICDYTKHDPEIFKSILLDIVENSKKTKILKYKDPAALFLSSGPFIVVI